MRMNLAALQEKLLAVARERPPADHVPYAFEKRVMARLASAKPEDLWSMWGSALWRGAAACLTVAVLLTVFAFAQEQASSATNLSQVYDSTVSTAADQLTDSW